MIRILLIGPLPPPLGGNTRHFATLVDDLGRSPEFELKLIDTSRGEEHSNPLRNLLVSLKTISSVAVNLHRVDVVSYHASNRGIIFFGPFIVAMSKLGRTPIVLRIFGGSFGDYYLEQSRLKKALVRSLILSADVVLVQTRRAIDQLQGHAKGRLEWFSTYIKTAERTPVGGASEAPEPQAACSRFVFLGHLWKAKGLEIILDAAPLLPGDSTLDIYGPLDEYTADEVRDRGQGRVRYCGFLSHEEVDAVLWNYDCLVLPTFYSNEGYPGVLAEAFAHGIPVITTRWLAIPEIVDDRCGILVEPEDMQGFVAALTTLHNDRELWLTLKEGATERAKQFDHAFWAQKFELVCKQSVERRHGAVA
jgi:glycosyltransferase involved in cell wall biosynthesis